MIPEERENMLTKKIIEPALKHLGIDNWEIIFFKDLEEFYNQNNRKKNIDVTDFGKIGGLPKGRAFKTDLDMFS